MPAPTTDDLYYVFVEGGIAEKKTTFLECVGPRLAAHLADAYDVVCIREPLAAWRNVGGHNLLEAFYREPARYALAFQTHAMATRVAAVRDALAPFLARPVASRRPVIAVCERSVDTDRHVFVEMLHASGRMTDMERAAYIVAYDYFTPHAYPGHTAAVLYLGSTPEACIARIKARGRPEEASITLEYLQQLEAAHVAALALPEAWNRAARHELNVDALAPNDTMGADDIAQRIALVLRGACRRPDPAAAAGDVV